MKKTNIIFLFITAFLLTGITCKKEPILCSPPPPQIPNGDFEILSLYAPPDIFHNYNDAGFWISNSCGPCMKPWITEIVIFDSVNVYHGKYALKFLYNNLYPAWVQNTFPISIHPLSLIAFIKSNNFDKNDSSSISIKLFKNNIVVDSGLWISTSTINNYTQINIPITQNATEIDTALIFITHGPIIPRGSSANWRMTYLWADYLSLHYK